MPVTDGGSKGNGVVGNRSNKTGPELLFNQELRRLPERLAFTRSLRELFVLQK